MAKNKRDSKGWKFWALVAGGVVMVLGAGASAAELMKQIKILKPTSNVFETERWIPVLGSIQSSVKNRSRELYEKVIKQFQVATNPRYTKTAKDTFCNIFARDVMLAMGAMLPQFFGKGADGKAIELNANAMHEWLVKYGQAFGWRRVSAEQAQANANAGRPTLASWPNPSGKSGHVAVIRPGALDPKLGPAAAQAGKTNWDNKHIANGYGDIVPTYWANA